VRQLRGKMGKEGVTEGVTEGVMEGGMEGGKESFTDNVAMPYL